MSLLQYLGLSSHVHPSLQELIEVLAKLARGLGQVLGGATRGLHQLIGRLVKPSCSLVEIGLSLLEALVAWWELWEGGGVIEQEKEGDVEEEERGRRKRGRDRERAKETCLESSQICSVSF